MTSPDRHDCVPSPKTIAIDLDDTLNDFTETLFKTRFAHDPAYGISADTFDKYVEMLRSGLPEANDLLSTEYSFFSYKIHSECYKLSAARPDGVEFMQWLRANRWRIIICTHRDLRRVHDATRDWLNQNGIPFDHLFRALDKVEFCKAWGIQYLVDDHPYTLACEDRYDIQIFYPILPKHQALKARRARGFRRFDELKEWIPR